MLLRPNCLGLRHSLKPQTRPLARCTARLAVLMGAWVAGGLYSANAEPPEAADPHDEDTEAAVANDQSFVTPPAPFSWRTMRDLPLAGGKYWGDVRVLLGWRIQRHVKDDAYRLLDPRDSVQASGTLQDCQQALGKVRAEKQIPPMDGDAVIVLHGLGRSRAATRKVTEYLQEHTDYTVLQFGYCSTAGTLEDHARALMEVVQNLEGVDRVHFVCHSLGNLVVRRLLAEDISGEGLPVSLGRFVMLAPPNQGAEMAEIWQGNRLFERVMGGAAVELSKGLDSMQEQLPVPACEFGILAGGRGNSQGWNPLLPGDDDMTVSVESTRLQGARDFLVLPLSHGKILKDKQALECATCFLKHGYFKSEGERSPIPLVAEQRAADQFTR